MAFVEAKIASSRKIDIRLPGKGNSNPHGARPVHLIITMIKWIQTSRLSIKNSLSVGFIWHRGEGDDGEVERLVELHGVLACH